MYNEEVDWFTSDSHSGDCSSVSIARDSSRNINKYMVQVRLGTGRWSSRSGCRVDRCRF